MILSSIYNIYANILFLDQCCERSSTPRMSNQIPAIVSSQTVAGLLPKLHDADPDYRFMSLNDLYQVLNLGKQDFLYNDYNTAARAVDGVLKTLDDQNGEVQNLAIKWYVYIYFQCAIV